MSLPSRLSLRVKAYLFRFLMSISVFLDKYVSIPLPPKEDFIIKISSSNDRRQGTIPLLFYTPTSYKRLSGVPSTGERKLFPVVINFHGGGFTIGGAKDDARWAASVVQQGAVLVSVDYGLAPEHPFPVGIDDCVEAIFWIWKHADEVRLDKSRVVLSGFSAGGNFSLTVPMRLHARLAQKNNGALPESIGKLSGIIAFYPGVDWTKSRAERTASNPISGIKGPIPKVLYDLFDNSYLYPQPLDMSSQYLSPGLASEEILVEAMPDQIAIYTCEWDQLLVEGEAFRQRLQSLGKQVGGTMTKGVAHGWDKRPTFRKGNKLRDQVYGEAIIELRKMLQL